MAENKTGKYLKYAVGEIVLVVLGILIALALNNWNEERKLQKEEVAILQEILRDITESEAEALRDLNSHKAIIKIASDLLEHMIKRHPQYDSLARDLISSMTELQFYPKSSGFETLKSMGLNAITNEKVRIGITDLYQLNFQRLIQMGRIYNQFGNSELDMSKFAGNYIVIDKDASRQMAIAGTKDTIPFYGLQIKNYDDFIIDDEIISKLHKSIAERSGKINLHIQVIDRIQEVKILINDELKELGG